MVGLAGDVTAPLSGPRLDESGNPIAMSFEEENGSPKYIAGVQLRILNDIVDKEGSEHVIKRGWTGNFRPDGNKYFLVRRVERKDPGSNEVKEVLEVAPEPIELPRRPEQFVRALSMYQQDKHSWEEVKKEANRQAQKSKSADGQIVDELSKEAETVADLEQAAALAKKIQNKLASDHSQVRAFGALSHAIERVVDNMTRSCDDFKSLRVVYDNVKAFLDSGFAEQLIKSRFLNYLDAAALRVGRQRIAAAISPDDLRQALEAIHNHPFAFAHVYAAPFREAREDALAKIDFLLEISRKREPGLDELTRRVAAHKFKSVADADLYRSQIFGFIERKRAILKHREVLREARGLDI